ncbi:hypothetical protein [Novosphingobium olei]|uniref:Uncharacterized protein n=1 Tax=Novosphingobium olei TaxID=2728851 RepID=A0A7Y0BQ36_9SPHN|nr:hypothetical protein [Novosphingobium olei]NML93871.1 hypothetical protein [Novosphingobium olei]BEV01054.1 hypothetical protein NSDW_21480 [Novosphingobium olei]
MATRAINLALPEQDIIDQCKRKDIRISAIEPLRSGGTHLVCLTIEGADAARVVFKKAIIEGAVKRFAFLRHDEVRYR